MGSSFSTYSKQAVTGKPETSKPEPLLALYKALALALQSGSQDAEYPRPALPTELVRYIFRLAECTGKPSVMTVKAEPFSIRSNGDLAVKLWFHTHPLSSAEIYRVWGVEQHTSARNQGFVDDILNGCWSWFDIAIYSPVDRSCDTTPIQENDYPTLTIASNEFKIKRRADGSALKWLSHYVDVYKRGFFNYNGALFGAEHELWLNLKPRDCIAVLGCCQYPGWACEGDKSSLRIWEYYDPVNPTNY